MEVKANASTNALCFYRASTARHAFNLSIPMNTVSEVRICYSQKKETVSLKKLSDCKVTNNTLEIELSQEETKMFAEGEFECQIRVCTVNGKSIPSKIFKGTAMRVLDEEVFA